MNNMRIPARRAPTIEDARRLQNNNKQNQSDKKKTPPPRPPPPNFTLSKSKSAWSLTQADNTISLIDWSPPNSPKPAHPHSLFNGSVSSSFSSSTSSLASSKKSYESENNDWMLQPPAPSGKSTFYQKLTTTDGAVKTNSIGPGPTIIRAAPPKKRVLRPTASASTSREVSPLPPFFQSGILTPTPTREISSTSSPDKECASLPMPSIPPPSPPKDLDAVHTAVEPFGIALYDYNTGQEGDLYFMTNDVIYLVKQINVDWLMGRTVDDREGMFPASFVDIQVPLPAETTVKVLYDFETEVPGDLRLKTGDCVKVLRVIDANWLEGECNGRRGQFPANFVDRIPNI